MEKMIEIIFWNFWNFLEFFKIFGIFWNLAIGYFWAFWGPGGQKLKFWEFEDWFVLIEMKSFWLIHDITLGTKESRKTHLGVQCIVP
ncbi:hypothetical protein [Bacillus amyloliquefaciens]|uniref:hypothetical protein n=1 Tax=Bacillus amyloliquefaciens TaxID=1390 RepID=UPI0014045698|nr:hypothetical protein [Bacillus amyloliquefaciens]NHN23196.1 hypothetical protein [Bacillus amyloliquefaciens]